MRRRNIYILFFITLYSAASITHGVRQAGFFGSEYTLKSSTATLVLGDSHASVGLDPEILTNAENLAINSEYFIYTYYKLKFLSEHVRNFAQVKNLVLSVSPASVNARRDHTMRGYDDERSFEFFSKYYRLMDSEGMKESFGFNSSFFYHFLKYDLYVPLNLIDDLGGKKANNLYELDFVTGYVPKDSSNTADTILQQTVYRHFMGKDSIFDQEISHVQVKYLDKIAAFCSEKGIVLHLVQFPLHPGYRSLIPDQYWNNVKKIFQSAGKGKNVQLHDFSTKYDNELNYFKDGDHLNRKGSNVFSSFFRETVLDKTQE